MNEELNNKDWTSREEEGFNNNDSIDREELCVKNNAHVIDILSQYDPVLAELFYKIENTIMVDICNNRRYNHGELFTKYSKNGFLDSVSINGEKINVILSDIEGNCYENCVLFSDCHWSGRGISFQKYAKEIVKYWLECSNVNKRTLIFTTSWDEKSFKERYKDEFDIYSKHHKLSVILITSTGPLIVYLGR